VISIFIATLALGTVAVPATDPETPVAAVAPASLPTPTVSAKTRYCVVDTLTGSRIPRRACKTRAEWLERGFDPAAK
jgi:hypothetical protein